MTENLDGRRSPWLTVPLHVVGWVVLAADLWGAVFWARVGGTVGLAVGLVGAVVAVLLATVLVVDLRGQLNHREVAPSSGAPAAGG